MSSDSTPLQSSAVMSEAVQTLRDGGLVAFPTETVYGLGADAKNTEAIKKIFTAKGRPSNHPLIVHLAAPDKFDQAQIDWVPILAPWARDVSEEALKLINAFWPGPLTLVFKKDKSVLTALTGGQDTVAIRAPSHPIAKELLRKFKGGVVAPSANRFGKVSPTSAADVRHEFEGMLDLMVLDGGDCEVGIESTIIDLSSGDKAVLLRPGAITPSEIFAKTGVKVYLPGELQDSAQELPKVSGSLKAHYAPTTPLRLYAPGRVLDALSEFPDIKSRVAVAVWDSDSSLGDDGHPSAHFEEVEVPSDSASFASRLYRSLRDLDQQGWDLILFPEPPAGEEWDGVRDRLQRACFGSGPSSSNQVSN
ncbi:L-threonylcarbamoyladenylate synthase [Polynucleobacter sp. MWH-Jannik1A5]|jgi:L-threonylcarbamoyladenylate synthase|uniref:L-threonylcarbamoyladenylate synthase n=1 Tax=Polynucleobacter sp. MWH-Jannik1A5 TaxID=1855890 RepID=UPI001C0C9ED9|nr:L-threonylcarbamoyladenylate synthase [Polynucleobacter sp. MWH-Jannik1A5]MBU3546152.1 threonylcarbamoyl-AMP synthase [Polynucleobacter sp. MWH-Jannik1A5]